MSCSLSRICPRLHDALKPSYNISNGNLGNDVIGNGGLLLQAGCLVRHAPSPRFRIAALFLRLQPRGSQGCLVISASF